MMEYIFFVLQNSSSPFASAENFNSRSNSPRVAGFTGNVAALTGIRSVLHLNQVLCRVGRLPVLDDVFAAILWLSVDDVIHVGRG